MNGPYVGEIIGFRIIHDAPPEVLVRTRRPVYILMPYFGQDPNEATEVFAGHEWDSEWREADEIDLAIMEQNRVQFLKRNNPETDS